MLEKVDKFQTCIAIDDEDILEELLRDKRSPQTRRAYAKDLKDFFGFLSIEPSPKNVGWFLSLSKSDATTLVLRYKASLRERVRAATVNRRLAAIKSLVAYAEKTGRCGFLLTRIKGEKVQPYRDTTGVDGDVITQMLDSFDRFKPKGMRDYAILRLLWGLALRRSEVVSLDVGDVDLDSTCIWILGKGKSDRERMSISPKISVALGDWLKVYNPQSNRQPLFVSLARNAKGIERLSDDYVYKLVRDVAKSVNVAKAMSPHKIRHSAITYALDKGADIREVRRLSRHAKIETLMIYDDNRSDMQGNITRLLDQDI